MTAALPRDVWVPVPLRWRHVALGDVFVGQDGGLWSVESVEPSLVGLDVVVRSGAGTFEAGVDPDAVVQVLVPVTEREALELARDELGARVAARRTSSAG